MKGPPPAAAQALTRPLDAVIDDFLAAAANGWQPTVRDWRASADGQALQAHLATRLAAGAVIYPAQPLRALMRTPLDAVRIVILGQDPYHGPDQAEGLAFSVPPGQRCPPSLRNVFVELQRDLGLAPPRDGHLGGWAERGVLLLNSVLTVEEGQPASHARRGWESLTDALLGCVAARQQPTVFMLWGAYAQAKAALIEGCAPGRHTLLRANHPSPLSARRPPLPFIGCGHFSQAAACLGGFDWGP